MVNPPALRSDPSTARSLRTAKYLPLPQPTSATTAAAGRASMKARTWQQQQQQQHQKQQPVSGQEVQHSGWGMSLYPWTLLLRFQQLLLPVTAIAALSEWSQPARQAQAAAAALPPLLPPPGLPPWARWQSGWH
jgi:hypothetical protein